jgi:hypothetical protein
LAEPGFRGDDSCLRDGAGFRGDDSGGNSRFRGDDSCLRDDGAGFRGDDSGGNSRFRGDDSCLRDGAGFRFLHGPEGVNPGIRLILQNMQRSYLENLWPVVVDDMIGRLWEGQADGTVLGEG